MTDKPEAPLDVKELLLSSLSSVIDNESIDGLTGATKEIAVLVQLIVGAYVSNDASPLAIQCAKAIDALTMSDSVMQAIPIVERMALWAALNTMRRERKRHEAKP